MNFFLIETKCFFLITIIIIINIVSYYSFVVFFIFFSFFLSIFLGGWEVGERLCSQINLLLNLLLSA